MRLWLSPAVASWPRRMDNGPSLISSITLPPSSPSPSFSDSTPGGSSLLNGPHSYSQTPEVLKVSMRDGGREDGWAGLLGSRVSVRYHHHYTCYRIKCNPEKVHCIQSFGGESLNLKTRITL